MSLPKRQANARTKRKLEGTLSTFEAETLVSYSNAFVRRACLLLKLALIAICPAISATDYVLCGGTFVKADTDWTMILIDSALPSNWTLDTIAHGRYRNQDRIFPFEN